MCTGKMARVRGVIACSYGVAGAAEGGELLLEGGHLRSEYVAAALQDSDDGVVKLWLEALILRFEVEQRNAHQRSPS
jgi:hypothetical protein